MPPLVLRPEQPAPLQWHSPWPATTAADASAVLWMSWARSSMPLSSSASLAAAAEAAAADMVVEGPSASAATASPQGRSGMTHTRWEAPAGTATGQALESQEPASHHSSSQSRPYRRAASSSTGTQQACMQGFSRASCPVQHVWRPQLKPWPGGQWLCAMSPASNVPSSPGADIRCKRTCWLLLRALLMLHHT